MPQMACPVCTLFLREGMSLSKHLHTHPKAKVVEALARITTKNVIAADSPLLAVEMAPAPPPPPPPPPPPQLTSILYHQQFLSSTTTSFVDPSCLPPPPQLIMMTPAPTRLSEPSQFGTRVTEAPQFSTRLPEPTQQFATRVTEGQQFATRLPEPPQFATRVAEFAAPPTPLGISLFNSYQQTPTTQAHQTGASNHGQNNGNAEGGQVANQRNFQYPQLENLNFQQHAANDVARNTELTYRNEEEVERQVMNIGTVITDSQKIISNSSMYLDQTSPPRAEPVYLQNKSPGRTVYGQNKSPSNSVYVQTSNAPVMSSPFYVQTINTPGSRPVYNTPIYAQNEPQYHNDAPGSSIHRERNSSNSSSIYGEQNAPGSPMCRAESAPGRSYQGGSTPGRSYQEASTPGSPVFADKCDAEVSQHLPPHSPASSGYSVRVRRDLGTPARSPLRHDEYILPGYDFHRDDDDDDNSELVDDSGLSMPPLNIHTDESMPPRGELSGHGTTSSSSIWQTRGLDLQQPSTTRKPTSTASTTSTTDDHLTPWGHADAHEAMESGGLHIHPDSSQEAISVIRESQHSLIQFSTNAGVLGTATAEPFNSVCFKKEKKVKEEAGPTIKVDDIKEDTDRKEVVVKRRVRTCATCDQTFPNAEEFNNHIKRVHPFECKACGRCFMRASGLTLHQKRHLKIKPYRCSYCEKSFVTNQKLTEHHNSHTGNSPHKCSLCEATFKRYSNLVQHRNRTHLKKKRKAKDYFCDCGEVFHSPLKLAWHKEKHDPTPKKCTFCSSRFIHVASLTRHIRKAHDPRYIPEGRKYKLRGFSENVECHICHKICLKGSLRNHMVVHSGVKKYACSSCGKRFFSKWNMKLHMWVHASRSSMPHKCTVKSCKASFIRENDLQDHMRAHKNQKQYSCNYCGRQFLRKYNWVRHTREHEQNKKHECTVCGKKFHRGYYLTEHMRIHTGFRPFTCHICSKQTATKTNHNKHLKTHHAREIIASEN
ncbi:uncharacterized protein LOC111044678 isoform X2 [Nilaparvata lugens]|uniref:uncharacterized protein LOC111044678 isoform X2 n=1 Tax=Nilaparvata lugens TaxID=108931 RepID=UPI00193D415D|nr:uncharacterized protein LOC111044678 isoform X2 [Nilaparvata lugens]